MRLAFRDPFLSLDLTGMLILPTSSERLSEGVRRLFCRVTLERTVKHDFHDVGGEGGNRLPQWSQSRPCNDIDISRKPCRACPVLTGWRSASLFFASRQRICLKTFSTASTLAVKGASRSSVHPLSNAWLGLNPPFHQSFAARQEPE